MATITLDGLDISQYSKAVDLNIDVLTTAATVFLGPWAEFATNGTKSWSMNIAVNQDFDFGAIDAILWARWALEVPIDVRPFSTP